MKVLISTTSFGSCDALALQTLRDNGFEVILNRYGRTLRPEESVELLAGCVGLIAGTEVLNEAVLQQAKQLRAISRCGVGTDTIDMEATARLGISVRCTPGVAVDAVAELTVALMLDLARMVTEADRHLKSGKWFKPMGRLLKAKTVGIVGLGQIGKRVAELLQPFHCRMLVHDLFPDTEWARRQGAQLLSLYSLLTESDILTLHIPYSQSVHHLIGERELSVMKRGALLINTARGGLVDEEGLCRVLKDGHLGGAALDVYESEPYEGPLCSAPHIIMTPHIGSYATESRIAMEREAVTNLLEMLDRPILP